MQNPVGKPHYFLNKLHHYLKANACHFSGERKGKVLLWLATRICAQRLYQNRVNHHSPEQRTLKKLEIHGIFEAIIPTVFGSGSEGKLLKNK